MQCLAGNQELQRWEEREERLRGFPSWQRNSPQRRTFQVEGVNEDEMGPSLVKQVAYCSQVPSSEEVQAGQRPQRPSDLDKEPSIGGLQRLKQVQGLSQEELPWV